MKHLSSVLLAAASIGICGAATAAPVDTDGMDGTDRVQVRTEVVEYDADEIRDTRSAQRLFFRIRRAAEEVCRLSSHPVGYELWDEHACEVDAVAEAVQDAGLPALDQLHSGRPGEGASIR